MTRVLVYSGSMAVFVATTVLTLTALVLPHWINYHEPTPSGTPINVSLGLHRRCAAGTPCTPFPQASDCIGDDSDRYFCSIWRSVGFLMNLAVLLECVTLIAYITIFIGGRQKRERGWVVMCALLVGTATLQCGAMALVAWLYDWDDRFFVGWQLDVSWILTTVSWCLVLGNAMGLAMSGWFLPPEDGYELLN